MNALNIAVVTLQCALLFDFHFEKTDGASCPGPYSINNGYNDKNQKTLVKGINAFTLQLDIILSRTVTKGDNIIFAPINLVRTLATVLLGASGETKEELSSVLKIVVGKRLTNDVSKLHKELATLLMRVMNHNGTTSASGIFISKKMLICSHFKMLLKIPHGTNVIKLDFAKGYRAADVINRWISKKTNNKITNLMKPPVANDTSVLFSESLHFSSNWNMPFFRAATTWSPFYFATNTGRRRKWSRVKMMTNCGRIPYYRDDDLNYTAIGLLLRPKITEDSSSIMFVVLPDVNVDLKYLISRMNSSDIQNITNRYAIRHIHYYVPQMKINEKIGLRNTLKKLNVRSAFDPVKADFSNMASSLSDNETVYANEIIHQVDLEVNEAGQPGIAGTVITGATKTIRYGKSTFRADRPFLFFVYHLRSKVITFWGSILRPKPFYPIK